MATVTFTAAPPPIDTVLDQLALDAAAAQKPIRIRLQPDVYEYSTRLFKTWTGLVWFVECEDVEEGRRLREGLADFFKAFGTKRQEKLLKVLQGLAGRD